MLMSLIRRFKYHNTANPPKNNSKQVSKLTKLQLQGAIIRVIKMEPGFMMLVLEVLDQSLRKGVKLQAGWSVLQLPGHFNAELKRL
ncbi:uncharacterized protein LOC128224790 isoform X2 [Mya arenaria]|uniref:uncharacterized protein LOC128224790 isoform X2 n=1 Tax=Mya arenaria TaxID=6604 RepID=UPI0022E49D89|nr:uncharacterized protein LOC128224790 isoform X2 [Mya arenaria]XP_052790804.1 uncharacterized protein LOC128224790 isoform X2 [Mya arenaria]XP_052790805.1 uncharacterized protein LOC128224790 isoform X2 [Mya arenaria]